MSSGFELRHSLRFTGKVGLAWGEGATADLVGFELGAEGNLDSPDLDLRLTLVGPLAELRKFAHVSLAWADMLSQVADQAPEVMGELRLATTRDLAQELAALAQGTDTFQTLMDREEWVSLLFTLDRFTPRSVSVQLV